jgi:hypothetical protein
VITSSSSAPAAAPATRLAERLAGGWRAPRLPWEALYLAVAVDQIEQTVAEAAARMPTVVSACH